MCGIELKVVSTLKSKNGETDNSWSEVKRAGRWEFDRKVIERYICKILRNIQCACAYCTDS